MKFSYILWLFKNFLLFKKTVCISGTKSFTNFKYAEIEFPRCPLRIMKAYTVARGTLCIRFKKNYNCL